MLTFKEAIEEIGKTEPTVGDVHAPGSSDQISTDYGTTGWRRFRRRRRLRKFALDSRMLKADGEQRKIFGWASISSVDGKLVVDKQGDIIPPEELESAAHDFVLYSRQQGDMHENAAGRLIGSVVFTPEKAEKCGLVAKNETGQQLYGWWVEFQVDGEFWQRYKDGYRPELSIGGRAESSEYDGSLGELA